jgi:hypothetical protein
VLLMEQLHALYVLLIHLNVYLNASRMNSALTVHHAIRSVVIALIQDNLIAYIAQEMKLRMLFIQLLLVIALVNLHSTMILQLKHVYLAIVSVMIVLDHLIRNV